MEIRKSVLVAIAALSLAVPIAAACGGSSGEGGEGGGETPLVTFNDTAGKISLSYPSTWQKTSDQPLTFSGQDEFIAVEIRQSSGSDPVAEAKADEAAVQAAAPGFKLTGIAASKEVKNSAVMSYTWELGKSSVTGKAVPEQADRYYIDLGDGRIAVLTGSSPKTNFDREQVRDIALTLKVNK